MFEEKKGPHEHLFCVLCGHRILKRTALLPPNYRSDHRIRVAIQEFIGGGPRGPGNGFVWTDRKMRRDELEALDELLTEISARVRRELRSR